MKASCRFCGKTYITPMAEEEITLHELTCVHNKKPIVIPKDAKIEVLTVSSKKAQPTKPVAEFPTISIPSDWLTKEIGKNIK